MEDISLDQVDLDAPPSECADVPHLSSQTSSSGTDLSFGDDDEVAEADKPHVGRERWGSHTEFVLASVGFVIGIGNVWRFPYLCYSNGGGTFLIPYLVGLVGLALPMFTLEMIIGQTMQKGTYHALKHIHPRIRGVGIGACIVVVFVSIYYNVLLGWIMYFMIQSLRSPLPWSETLGSPVMSMPGSITQNATVMSAQSFWEENVLDMTAAPFEFGHIVAPLLAVLLAAWVLVYVCLRRGLAVTGKLLYFTAIFPLVILFLFLCISLSLEGAGEGISYYIKPDWQKLAGIKAWHLAAQQVFYSLGPGFGTVISLSSFNDQRYNAVRDSIFVGLVNSLASVISGFVVFGILGHLAHVRGVPVNEVVQAGQGLIFVAIPEALAGLTSVSASMRNFLSVLLFAMLFFLGIDSQFANLEAIIALFKDMGCTWSHKKIVLFVCTVGFILGIPLVTQGGIYWFDLIDSHAAVIALFVVVLAELLSVRFLYGFERLISEYEEQSQHRLGPVILFLWRWVCPIYTGLLLILSLASAAAGDEEEQAYKPTTGAYRFGIFVAIVPMVPMVLCAFTGDLTFKSHGASLLRFVGDAYDRARFLCARQRRDGVIEHVNMDGSRDSAKIGVGRSVATFEIGGPPTKPRRSTRVNET